MSLKANLMAAIVALFLSTTVFANSGKLTGQLTDPEQQPLAGFTIHLVPIDYKGTAVTFSSEEDGTFEREAVSPASYYVRWEPTDYVAYGVEAVARLADGSIAWESAGPLDPANEAVWDIPTNGEVFIWLTLKPKDADLPPYQSQLAALTGQVQQGQCSQAIAGLVTYTAQFASNSRAQYLLGFCYASTGQVDLALPALEDALEGSPGMPGVALLAGQALLQVDRKEEAIAWLTREIEANTNPDLALEALVALAFAQRDLGQQDEAIQAFTKASYLDPEREDVVQELLTLLLKTDQTDQALQVLNETASETTVDVTPFLNQSVELMNAKSHEAAADLLEQVSSFAQSDEARANTHALLGRALVASGKVEEGRGHCRTSLSISQFAQYSNVCQELLK